MLVDWDPKIMVQYSAYFGTIAVIVFQKTKRDKDNHPQSHNARDFRESLKYRLQTRDLLELLATGS